MANLTGKKFGGRQKGTPNKDSLKAEEIAERLGVDPFEVLLLAAAGDWKSLGYDSGEVTKVTKFGVVIEDRISIETRVTAAAHATQYLLPKRKAIEVSAPVDPLDLDKSDYKNMSTAELIRLVKPGAS